MTSLFQIAGLTFAHPYFFLGLVVIPIAFVVYTKFIKSDTASLHISSTKGLDNITTSWRIKLRPWLHILRLLSFIFFIIALARPQKKNTNESINSEGIDIIISLDISGSMLAQDFNPNRIEAAKKVAQEFISSRVTDRMGLVIFSGESFTQCPLTTDKNVLLAQLQNIQSGSLEDGTAIGMGLSTAVDRLRASRSKTKIIILLTDGINNGGLVDPITALEIAKAFNIKVYTIGVGTQGMANYPTQDAFGNTIMEQQEVQIDEVLLKKISNETRGKYFRATDNQSLNDIYKEIDKLEKSKIEISSYTQEVEYFFWFAGLAFILLIIEIIARYTFFKTL